VTRRPAGRRYSSYSSVSVRVALRSVAQTQGVEEAAFRCDVVGSCCMIGVYTPIFLPSTPPRSISPIRRFSVSPFANSSLLPYSSAPLRSWSGGDSHFQFRNMLLPLTPNYTTCGVQSCRDQSPRHCSRSSRIGSPGRRPALPTLRRIGGPTASSACALGGEGGLLATATRALPLQGLRVPGIGDSRHHPARNA
jgi:hypothetical protein